MIEAVFTFALVTMAFEFVLLMKLNPARRLRVLGSTRWVTTIHVLMIMINILIHFGTITGSMTAVTAGLTSFITIPLVRWISGQITNNHYFPGIVKYSVDDLQ